MKKFITAVVLLLAFNCINAQVKTELYDLIKKLLYDSTGYSNVGDWAVGTPKTFPVKWKEERIVMSDDTAINFYRSGSANISLKGKSYTDARQQPVKWNIMLKGPRMGYTSFSIISAPSNDLSPRSTIDSLFGNKPYTATLIKSCDSKILAGYYYYQVKLPKKDMFYIKFSWISINGNTALRIDAYDDWSRYAVKLDCAK